MENTNWLKQTPGKPLFPDLLWSKPENKRFAGKLLIAGGNLHAVAAPGLAHSAALGSGVGVTRVLLPDATKKLMSKVFPEAEFAPSTPSGSFARQALDQLLESAQWSDGVLLAGDFGRNSETAVLLESFAEKYHGQLTLTQDTVDYFTGKNSILFNRPNTLVAADFGQLQKLAQANRPNPPIKYSMDLHQLVEALNQWSKDSQIKIITNHVGQFVVSCGGKASTTPTSDKTNWQVELAAYASVWLLQQPAKPFEALTTAVYEYLKT